ncbi:unnamed protein product, partial [Ectocarpus sp. 13 AM-2016]
QGTTQRSHRQNCCTSPNARSLLYLYTTPRPSKSPKGNKPLSVHLNQSTACLYHCQRHLYFEHLGHQHHNFQPPAARERYGSVAAWRRQPPNRYNMELHPFAHRLAPETDNT